MNKYRLVGFSAARRTFFVLALLTTAFAGFLFVTKQSAMKPDDAQISDSTRQPNTLGRLAYERTDFTGAGGRVSLLSVNADGTNAATLAVASVPPLFCGEPSYSPDGTKIVYVQDTDIFVMDASGSNKINITNNPQIGDRNPSWSAANRIAYERESQIWMINPDGSNQARFAAITQPSPFAPAWSPDGSKLAFTSGGEIWVINADGTNERRVTNNSTTDADPAWSPDGAKIIFGKVGSGIAVINLDGTNETNLTNNTTDGKPAWSNDGTRIAFVRRTGGTGGGIYTMEASGANQTRIVADVPNQPNRSENDNPAWQPTTIAPGTFIVSGRITQNGAGLSGVTVNLFGSINATVTTDTLGNYSVGLSSGGNYTVVPRRAGYIFTPARRVFNNLTANQIADFAASETCSTPSCSVNGKIVFVSSSNILTANSDGSNAVLLTTTQRDNEPIWSPDGSKIVFESRRDSQANVRDIYSMNADGTSVVRLTNNTVEDFNPTFSPDGTKILFVSKRDGNGEIYVMNADGTNPLRLTNNQFEEVYPTYSPSGAQIVFGITGSNPNGLYTMNADGSNVVRITNTFSAGLSDITPSFSPDGTKIVFARYNAGPFTSVILTVNPDGTNPTSIVPEAFNYKPSFAPDGTKIIYSKLTPNLTTYEVRTVLPTGGDQLLFANGDRADWQPIRGAAQPARFDFDADGKSDVSVFRPSNGIWYRLNSGNNSFFAVQFGLSTDRIAPADYDGDGKSDIAVFRSGAAAYFYILNSADNTFRAAQFGTTDDVPVPGDWDGDGQDDVAVYRGGGTGSGQSAFYYQPSGTNFVPPRAIINGTVGKPVAADYDGDGKFDAALFLSSNVWSIRRSSDNQISEVNFGLQTDVPTAADFDGDGKADIAVFRPSNGIWYILRSIGGSTGVQFGTNGDVPVPADYDGDGKADVSVFRPSSGIWYLNRSTAGFTGIQFGTSGDKPAPNAFVP